MFTFLMYRRRRFVSAVPGSAVTVAEPRLTLVDLMELPAACVTFA
jgi:hypothetical protein